MTKESKIHLLLFRNLFIFWKHIFTNSLMLLAEPLLIFLCLGLGLDLVVGEYDGQKYRDFLLPGLTMSITMMTAFYYSSIEFHQRVFGKDTFRVVELTTIDANDFLTAEIFWVFLKSFVVGILLLSFLYILGSFEFLKVLEIVPMMALNCLWSIGLGLVALHFFKTTRGVLLFQTLVLVPLYFTCGIFYPMNLLPQAVQKILFFVPLTHSTMATHSILKSEFSSVLVLNGIILFIASYFLLYLGFRKIKAMHQLAYKEI